MENELVKFTNSAAELVKFTNSAADLVKFTNRRRRTYEIQK